MKTLLNETRAKGDIAWGLMAGLKGKGRRRELQHELWKRGFQRCQLLLLTGPLKIQYSQALSSVILCSVASKDRRGAGLQ